MTVATGDPVMSEVVGCCPCCGYSIIPGHLIRFVDGRWRHNTCPAGRDANRNALQDERA